MAQAKAGRIAEATQLSQLIKEESSNSAVLRAIASAQAEFTHAIKAHQLPFHAILL